MTCGSQDGKHPLYQLRHNDCPRNFNLTNLFQDLRIVCSHESWISEVSNVNSSTLGPPHPDFSSRWTTYNMVSVTSQKSPNVFKSCPKIISLEKLKILTPLQKLPKNMLDLGKLIVATGLEKLPKVQ